jgi:Tfp pilus assembly protein PilP
MNQTMRRTISNLAIGLALLLASGGTLHAQVNPATVKTQAQNGVNQAQQTRPPSQGQSQNNAPARTAPKTQAQNQDQNSRQGTSPQSNPPSKPPVTNPAKQPAPKPPTANNSATQKEKKPPVTMTPPAKTTPKTAQANHPAPAGHPVTQAPPKTTAKTPAKTPAKTQTTTSRPVPPPARRDPFVTLVGKHQGGSEGEQIHLPPGKAGLQVNTLVIQGILSSPGGMIAVVANPQRSVYFLHAGDELFDGRVERIEIDGVTFHEVGKDAFGKPLERQVTRKLNPSLGEQP